MLIARWTKFKACRFLSAQFRNLWAGASELGNIRSGHRWNLGYS